MRAERVQISRLHAFPLPGWRPWRGEVAMSQVNEIPPLEKFREYLILLARLQLGQPSQKYLEVSDLVQATLLRAHGNLPQFRGRTEAEMAGWLRTMLAFVIKDAHRAGHR